MAPSSPALGMAGVDQPRACRGPVSSRKQFAEHSKQDPQKDTDARRKIKSSKAKSRPDGTKQAGIAIPVFGCRSRVSVDRRNGTVRQLIVADAGAHDGARLREGLIETANTGREAQADADPTGREGRQAQIGGPDEGRARIRPQEAPHGAEDPHDRNGPRHGGGRAGEHSCNMNRLRWLRSRTASA